MSIHYEVTPFVPDPAVYPSAIKLPFIKLGKPIFENGYNATPGRCSLATLTFTLPLPAVESQRSLLLPGACPMLYDGARTHEAGFNYYPENVGGSGASGGALTNASYGVCFLYEWQDAAGVFHRSASSVPVTVAIGATNALSCHAPWLHITDKQDANDGAGSRMSAVRIVPYRTTAGGTVYYRDTPQVATVYDNSLVEDSVDAVMLLVTSDALLVQNELLPTTGGGLDAEAFPSSTIACQHQRRTFFVLQEEQSFLQYTDETDERFLAQQTNEVYRIPIPTSGGSVVGLASMDEKLIILCQRKIFFVFGEGPNRLGQQNGYSLPQICSSLLGMAGGFHSSIALTPEGLWFMSSTRTLRLLGRDMQIREEADQDVNYFGSDADGLISDDITAARACVIDSKNQVRWYLSDTTVITWDYAQKQWSRQTNHDSTGGAVSARGVFFHSDGTHLYSSKTTAGGYDDATSTPQVIESAWLKLADVQGYQRVYSLMILAQAASFGYVQIEEGFDYRDTYVSPVDPRYTLTPVLLVNLTSATGVVPHNLVGNSASGTVRSDIAGVDVGDPVSSSSVYFIVENCQPNTYQVGETITGGGFSGDVAAVYTGFILPLATNVINYGVITEASDTWQGAISNYIDIVPTASDPYQLLLVPVFTIGDWATATGDVSVSPLYTTSMGPLPGAPSNNVQFEHKLSYQQCQAFRFRLTITPSYDAEFLRLTNFALSIGMKRGLFKLPSSKRF